MPWACLLQAVSDRGTSVTGRRAAMRAGMSARAVTVTRVPSTRATSHGADGTAACLLLLATLNSRC